MASGLVRAGLHRRLEDGSHLRHRTLSRARETGRYAGDADPYREPPVDEGEDDDELEDAAEVVGDGVATPRSAC